jgi:CheY-like chemotaxis protein
MKPNRNYLILMADDDADDQLLVQDAFTECGRPNCVKFVGDGEELVDYLLRRGRYGKPADAPRPDLVLLDLNMPRKDGREALREIRAQAELKRVPVVVFTTSRADTDIERVYELGANSFVTKPTEFTALVRTVTELTDYWFKTVELPSLSPA